MPNPSTPKSQSLTFLLRRFKEAGIHPRTRFGQNFLIDLNLQRLLLDSAELEPGDVVLEVGTGTGSLTVLMAQRAAAIVTIEVDRDMFRLADEELHETDNVRMLLVDVLKNKNTLEPSVLEAVREAMESTGSRSFKLVANLPFNVATPILSNLLTLDTPPKLMTVTIQKELADRIVAPPGCKDYGALSIWMQSQCETEIVRVMAPSVFWPRPKVTSAIIRLRLDEERRNAIPDRPFFHTFVRSMFFHRRKYLRSELLSACKKRLDKPQVDEILAQLDLDPTIRAETLNVETMLKLAETVRAKLGD